MATERERLELMVPDEEINRPAMNDALEPLYAQLDRAIALLSKIRSDESLEPSEMAFLVDDVERIIEQFKLRISTFKEYWKGRSTV